MGRKKLIAGNWKMYKTSAEAAAFADELLALFDDASGEISADVAVMAPYTQLAVLGAAFAESPVVVGAQNMHYAEEGAFTGEISASMLYELGVALCVIGHSERRQYFGETDESVNLKLKTALAHHIIPILCVGESLAQRDAGEQEDLVRMQLTKDFAGIDVEGAAHCVIAYEPIWAIGTGRTATPEQAQEMCAFIRKVYASLYDERSAEGLRILYGGSVKSANAAELFACEDIDGGLVGGASLVAAEFFEIIKAA